MVAQWPECSHDQGPHEAAAGLLTPVHLLDEDVSGGGLVASAGHPAAGNCLQQPDGFQLKSLGEAERELCPFTGAAARQQGKTRETSATAILFKSVSR